MKYDSEQIKRLRERYPPGTRIELDAMNGEADMPRGLRGTVDHVDDAGQLQMTWENGRRLALIPEADSFHKIVEPEQGMKLTI